MYDLIIITILLFYTHKIRKYKDSKNDRIEQALNTSFKISFKTYDYVLQK